MRIAYAFGICTVLVGVAVAQDAAKKAPAGPGLTLTTPAFADGAEIPARFTQSDPKPVSPRLQWHNVPPNTVSFALIMHDPDVAIQRKTDDVLHWLIFNIPGTARGLPEAVPPPRSFAGGCGGGENPARRGRLPGTGRPRRGPPSPLHVRAVRPGYEARP